MRKMLCLVCLLSVLCLSACMRFALPKPPSQAPEATQETGKEMAFKGSGTPEDPFLLKDAKDLTTLAQLVNQGKEMEYAAACYALTQDIVLNEGDASTFAQNAPENVFQPIGTSAALGVHAFSGQFDGREHSISGLYISANVEDATKENASFGLFGIAQDAQIRNLTLKNFLISLEGGVGQAGGLIGNGYKVTVENCSVEGHLRSGAEGGAALLAAYLEDSTVQNCNIRGDLIASGYAQVGGLCAEGKKLSVTSCQNAATINCEYKGFTNYVGGLCGYVQGGLFTQCSNEGAVIAYESSCAGGLVGKLAADAMTENTGLSKCKNTAQVWCGATTGGLIGELSDGYVQAQQDEQMPAFSLGSLSQSQPTPQATEAIAPQPIHMESCENLGNVQACENAGGLIGFARIENEMEWINCKNGGAVACQDKNSYRGGGAGGLCGYTTFSGGKLMLNNCVNSGEITGYAQGSAGGVVGSVYFSDDGAFRMQKSINRGAVLSGVSTGGLVGDINGSAADGVHSVLIQNCTNEGSISSSGYSRTGGIVGYCVARRSVDNMVISFCLNKGRVEAKDIASVGGIAGHLTNQEGVLVVENCENNGEVVLSTTNQFSPVGGIVGRLEYAAIRQCVHNGNVVKTNQGLAGGIAGLTQRTPANMVAMENCYYVGKLSVTYLAQTFNSKNEEVFSYQLELGEEGKTERTPISEKMVTQGVAGMEEVHVLEKAYLTGEKPMNLDFEVWEITPEGVHLR